MLFLITLHENVCCGCSLQGFLQDPSNEHAQQMFSKRTDKCLHFSAQKVHYLRPEFFYQSIYKPSYRNFPESRGKKILKLFFLFDPLTLNKKSCKSTNKKNWPKSLCFDLKLSFIPGS